MPDLAPRFPTEHFLNRELSLLQFQRRVLAQAADSRVPLLDRLRFLCIVSSNLDEFFEIRVSGIKEQIRSGTLTAGIDGLVPAALLERVSVDVHGIIAEQYALLNDEILPALEAEGIVFLRRGRWTDAQRDWIRGYFEREVSPVLTPIGLDPAHPFPRVLNKSLNFAIELEGRDAFGRDSGAAIVQAPRALPRVIRLPRELCTHPYEFVFLSSILHSHVEALFSGMRVLGCYQFRVTRNSDMFVDEEEVKDLRASLKGELTQRHFGDAVRLEVADNCSEVTEAFLLQHFRLSRKDLYRTPGIVNLVRLMQVPDWVGRPDLTYPPFLPGTPKPLDKNRDIFDAIRKQDILLHHPFQSFAPVIELIRSAADDPQVLAIKMTVYRTGTDSVLMEHLARAAQKGKEVTVVLELMARFDEEANITWANKLEEVGVHVVYGVFGYKTHAKLLMLVRREEGGLRRYCHLGTGNYHPRTTRMYTDFGLLTSPARPANRAAPRPLPSLHHGPRVVARSTEVAALRDGLLRLLSSVAAHRPGATPTPGIVRLRAFSLRRDGGVELAPPGCGDGTSYRALTAKGLQPVYETVVAVHAATATVVLDPPWGSGDAAEHVPLRGWWVDAAAPHPDASLALRVAHAAHCMAGGWFDDGFETIATGPHEPLAALVTLHHTMPPQYGRPFG